MSIHLLVLNYNGRSLLEECLPSVVRAAELSRHDCRVAVIDNASHDDSVPWLRCRHPHVEVIHRPNRGLCSFNEVLAELDSHVAILLNNDIRMADDAVDPLVAPLLEIDPSEPSCFMAAPLCWQSDGETYEGFRTAVCWRWGLVQATAHFPRREGTDFQPDLTASAGAALAVDRRIFLELGGFDPLYLPGRIEDLDFAFRGYLAGYVARYVPESVVYHRGMSTFGKIYGVGGCDRLALRNTLLFQWKNLRHPQHVVRQLTGFPLRIARDVARAPWEPTATRLPFVHALVAAWAQWRKMRGQIVWPQRSRREERWPPLLRQTAAERAFFRRFHPRRMAAATTGGRPTIDATKSSLVEVGI